MRILSLTIIYVLMTVMASAQTKGGEITRKPNKKVLINKRKKMPNKDREIINMEPKNNGQEVTQEKMDTSIVEEVIIKQDTIIPTYQSTAIDTVSIHISAQHQVPQNLDIVVGDVKFTMIYVKGGTFLMGATEEQGSEASSDESPAHQVTVSDFYIGETEVTQDLWNAVMNDKRFKKGKLKPAVGLSWEECQDFIMELNNITGRSFRLPTEAEWEYAARGGRKDVVSKYAGGNSIAKVARCQEHKEPKEIKSRMPNELGIYDMSGNVEEYCSDWYDKDYYKNSPKINPKGPQNKTDHYGGHVIRGGCIYSVSSSACRVSSRGKDYGSPYIGNGFRLSL